jgi:HPt (histidine-containing phosphotransfer) domain-containing protein
MQDTPILEISRLQEIFEDDTAGIVELLESAMKTGAGYQATLRSAVAANVLDDVMRAAHAIKGSASNVGGNEVAAVAGRIENAARAQTWDGIADDAVELDRAYDRLRDAIAAYRTAVS